VRGFWLNVYVRGFALIGMRLSAWPPLQSAFKTRLEAARLIALAAHGVAVSRRPTIDRTAVMIVYRQQPSGLSACCQQN
jgi:hypothetical protein